MQSIWIQFSGPANAVPTAQEKSMKFKRFHKVAQITSLVGLALAAWPAMAQQSAPKSEAVETDLERVVVTSQKRLQVAQDVPISLFSVSGVQLENSGITNVQDLGNSVAGVTIAPTNPGILQINIRGVTDLGFLIAGTPANGFYLDEIPFSATGSHQPDVGLWDVQRVEVLRGPQGTLFGEGSMGGTIRVITKKPDASEFSGRVGVGTSSVSGGGTGYSVKGSVNIPLKQDVAAITIGVSDQKSPGWVAIPDLGLKDANTSTQTAGRFALRLTPSAQLTIDASYLQSKVDSNSNFGNSTSPGVLDPRAQNPAAQKIGYLSTSGMNVDVGGLTVNYDFGSATLVSATSSFKTTTPYNRDLTTVVPLFFKTAGTGSVASTNGDTIKSVTEELRLSSNGHKQLDWTAGLYYKDDQRYREENWKFNIPAYGPLIEDSLDSDASTSKAYAVFGEVDYAVTNAFSVQAGLRYYSETKSDTGTQITPSAVFGKPVGASTSSFDATNTSPKVSLNWKLTPDTLLFTKVSKGFRSGGANGNFGNTAAVGSKYPEMPGGYGPETITAYEAGVKSSPAKGWFLNAYVYQNKWQDLQLGFVTHDGLLGFTSNASSATAKGAELELGGRVSAGLTVGANLSYVDATIDSTVLNAVGAVVAKAGNAIPLTAKSKLALIADYSFPFSDALKGNFNARYQMGSSTFSEASNDPALKNDSTSQLHLKFGVSGPKWGSLSIHGDNLLNSNDTTIKQRQVGVGLIYNAYVQPRTIGFEYSKNF